MGVEVRNGISTVGSITAPGENVGVGVGMPGVGDGMGVGVSVGTGVGVTVGVAVGSGVAVGGTGVAVGVGVGKGVKVGGTGVRVGVGTGSSEQATRNNTTNTNTPIYLNASTRLIVICDCKSYCSESLQNC
jgi:hypothetical protein